MLNWSKTIALKLNAWKKGWVNMYIDAVKNKGRVYQFTAQDLNNGWQHPVLFNANEKCEVLKVSTW